MRRVVAAVAHYPRWSVRRPVREALLAHPRLSPADLETLLARAEDEDSPGRESPSGSCPSSAKRLKESLRAAAGGTSIKSINGS